MEAVNEKLDSLSGEKIDDYDILREYPFKSHWVELSNGPKMHYVDHCTIHKKEKKVLLCLHGNPTWSYFYRNVIKEFSSHYRVIAPDHIGMGLSDKPQTYEYTLQRHIENIRELLKHLKIEEFSLVTHDWGGAIGMGVAKGFVGRIEKMIFLNTAAYLSQEIPMRISLCRVPKLGDFIVRGLNGFAGPAVSMAVEKKLDHAVKKGYLFPYRNYSKRVAVHQFVKDIPLNADHPTYGKLKEIEESLPLHKNKKLFIWGGKDFCFNDHFFDRWREIYPEARFHYIEDANHYVLEDAKEECLLVAKDFLLDLSQHEDESDNENVSKYENDFSQSSEKNHNQE